MAGKMEIAARELLLTNPAASNKVLVPMMADMGFKETSAMSTLSRVRGQLKATGELSEMSGQGIVLPDLVNPAEPTVDERTDQEIIDAQNLKFEIIEEIGEAAINGEVYSAVVTGVAGMGKSFLLERLIRECDPYMATSRSGYARATELYRLINEYSGECQTILMDDIDSIFKDIQPINILKAATDSKKFRKVSWGSMHRMVDEDGEPLPNSIDYLGAFLFISNIDFNAEIAAETARSPHLRAFLDRAHYVDIDIHTPRERYLRIQEVFNKTDALAEERGIDDKAVAEILDFVSDHRDGFSTLTLRTPLKVADLYKINKNKWQSRVASSMFKRSYKL